MAVVAITYPSLPDPMLSHYDAAGNVTVWEPKNWGSALSGRTPPGGPRVPGWEREGSAACAGRTHARVCAPAEHLGCRTHRPGRALRDLLDRLGAGGRKLTPGRLARHRQRAPGARTEGRAGGLRSGIAR
ncbi:DUF1648 domain-containing protein [Corynebacterium pseudodiphtheriticum]|nr:DUF1648 domain-containing protein [Corynebacterium pseudodiphtheriticum]UNU77085.1 DUF1648 domain-containing protein [Corynebacterium pseudodiphtheriticum]